MSYLDLFDYRKSIIQIYLIHTQIVMNHLYNFKTFFDRFRSVQISSEINFTRNIRLEIENFQKSNLSVASSKQNSKVFYTKLTYGYDNFTDYLLTSS